MLTSQARESLRGVETLILDEVHAIAGSKRGAHLSISVERLEALVDEPMQRIGLSATQRPIEEIGQFVSGGRPITIVDAGTRKDLDLEVVVPVEDLRELGSTASLSQPVPADGQEMDSGTEHGARSIWPSIYQEVLRLVEEHRIDDRLRQQPAPRGAAGVRLNELAEKEIARAHHGSLAREQRVIVEEDLKAGRIPCLVATSSLELGIDMGAVDLVIQVESPSRSRAACSASAVQDTSWAQPRKGGSFRSSAPTCSSRPWLRGRCRGRGRGDADPAKRARRARAADRGDL